MPLRRQALVRQDLLDDSRTGRGTHGELATDEMAQVIDDGLVEVFCTLRQNEVKRANALTVQAKVLGEALRHAHLHPRLLVEEVSHRP